VAQWQWLPGKKLLERPQYLLGNTGTAATLMELPVLHGTIQEMMPRGSCVSASAPCGAMPTVTRRRAAMKRLLVAITSELLDLPVICVRISAVLC
jgi:hypothetical protein